MTKRNYTRHTKESLAPIVAECVTYSDVLRALGLKPLGGNFDNLRRNIQRFNLDTSHMIGQAHNKGREFKEFDGLKKRSSIKKRIISYRGHQCEKCSEKEWQGEIIPIELHHINGDPADNRKENLQLLCPNCHALTDNYRNRKR